MFTILHTNDFHNRLSTSQAAQLTSLRHSVSESGLLLDAGDAISAGNITFRPGGEPILDAMSDIGYDAMTVGNREFHFRQIGFRSKLLRARFPVLCANVRPSNCHPIAERAQQSNTPYTAHKVYNNMERPGIMNLPGLPVVPFVVHESRSGWCVVIFGITVPMITDRMAIRKASPFVFDDPLDIAAWVVPHLRNLYRPDLLVALTHIGLQRDRELAANVPDIDLIVGGHSHDTLEKGERVGGALIVQAGSHGRYIGRVEVERGKSNNRLEFHASLEAL